VWLEEEVAIDMHGLASSALGKERERGNARKIIKEVRA
jgi:hypothetical protein